jgi:hypothetical protein
VQLRPNTVLAVALAFALACVSCASYRMVGVAPEDAATIAIVMLENDSVEPGVEVVVSRALREGVLRRGSTRLVSDPRRADLVIKGTVMPLETLSTSFSTVALAIEYTVRMELDVEMRTADGDRIEIDRNALRESELYLASADVEAARKNRREALQRLADVLASRVHDALDLYLQERGASVAEGSS